MTGQTNIMGFETKKPAKLDLNSGVLHKESSAAYTSQEDVTSLPKNVRPSSAMPPKPKRLIRPSTALPPHSGNIQGRTKTTEVEVEIVKRKSKRGSSQRHS